MNVPKLVLQEALHRRTQSLLSLIAVIAAVALPVAFFTAERAAERETTRVMRGLGYNLRIVPADTDMGSYWSRGYSSGSLPLDAAERFATRGDLSFNHLLAMLIEELELEGEAVLLTGISSEVAPASKKKSSMIFEVPRGELYLGYEISSRLGLERGASLTWRGQEFTVAEALPESGTADDIRVYAQLEDARALLDQPGRINEIQALECYCSLPGVDNLEKLRRELSLVIPEGKVLRASAIATTRENQRRMAEEYGALVIPWVVLTSGLVIGLLAALGVRERRKEIGLLRALGHPGRSIAGLFLGKAAMIGVIGGVLGFLAGSWLAIEFGPSVFPQTGQAISVNPVLFLWALWGAPLFTVLSSLIPTALAVNLEPAICLRDLEAA
jgi:putative ABC transport system permease protein